MKKILFFAMLFIACLQGFAQTLQVNNTIPGANIQFRMKGHNTPGACNAMLAYYIPTSGPMTWNFINPSVMPLVWTPAYTGLPFSYDACYYEVVGLGGAVLCSGTIGNAICGWPTVQPITCLAGHTAKWTNIGGNITVNFF